MNYEKVLSKAATTIEPSGIRRFFDLAAEMEGVISLGVGEPDFVTPDHIRKVGIETFLGIIVSQFILFSIIAIARIPVGRLTIPMVMVVYALSIYGIASCYESKLKELKEEKEEKSK